jgi:peptide chain release factor 3
MMQMAQEGTMQILRSLSELESFVAAVGRLQFDVLQYRLRQEYRVETVLTPLPFECSAWLFGDPSTFRLPMDALIVKDRLDRPVVLFPTLRSKTFALERNPDHRLEDMG